MQNPPLVYATSPINLRLSTLENEISSQLRNSLICESQFGQLKMLDPKIKMLWTVNNFTNFINEDIQILRFPLVSPTLFVGVHGIYTIYLAFNLGQGQNEDEHTYIYLYVSNLDTKKNVKTKVLIEVLNSQSAMFWSCHVNDVISNPFGHPTICAKFLKRREILDSAKHLLLDNKFRIRCTVEICDTPSESLANLKKFQNHAEVSNDLKKLLNDDAFSDVTFVVSNDKFPAHRNILAARSSVFRAMFTNDMQEKRTHEVVINEIKPEVFKRLLLYIYSGTVELDASIAYELLEAADMYALDGLKKLCEVKLSSEIDIKNVIDILILADRHNVANLKKQALNFIANNARAVTSTPRYKSWCTAGDPLIGEAFQALAAKT